MIISLNWLKDMVDLEGISTEEIVKKLTLSTAEVEGVKQVGEDMEDVVVAKVVTASKVPDTHLFLLSVDDGSGELIQIATGAPNVYAGMVTALVRVDGKVGGRKIKKAKLAGIDSFGMCCSEAELGIGSDDNGIVDFSDLGLPIGADLKSIFPIEDTLIEIDNKSLTNRPDLWGHLGFARELSAIFGRDLKKIDLVDLTKLEGLPSLSIDVKADDCLRYSALRVENVTKKVSPYVMKIRLNYCGLRDINLLADLTNYVMLELGQPMHAFDSSIVNGVIVRESIKGEKILTLEGEEHEVPEGVLLITDRANEPVAIAGIKGGLKSGISETTTGFLLESAVFEPSKIRKASKSIGLSTDASIRYEKSLDPTMTDIAIARLVSLLKSIDNEIIISSSLTDRITKPIIEKKIDLTFEFIRSRIGAEISNEFILDTLIALGFNIEREDGKSFVVVVPSYRATKDISIKEDIVEEVARMYGYDNIVPEPILSSVSPVLQNPIHDAEYEAKRLLAIKFGVSEVHSHIWNYSDFNESIGVESPSFVRLVDSSNSGQSGIRSELAPTLLKFYSEIKNDFDEIKIAEIGRVAIGLDQEKRAIEEKHLSILFSSNAKTETEIYFELKKMIEFLSITVAGTTVNYVDSNKTFYMPSAQTGICVNGEVVGYFGIVHPLISSKLEKNAKIGVVELDFNKFCAFNQSQKEYKRVSKYQAVDMDFNFIVPNGVRYEEMEHFFDEFKCRYNVEYKLKDIYENKELFGENKSMTIGFTISSLEHTLSAGEIDGFRKRFVDHMKQNGIVLR